MEPATGAAAAPAAAAGRRCSWHQRSVLRFLLLANSRPPSGAARRLAGSFSARWIFRLKLRCCAACVATLAAALRTAKARLQALTPFCSRGTVQRQLYSVAYRTQANLTAARGCSMAAERHRRWLQVVQTAALQMTLTSMTF